MKCHDVDKADDGVSKREGIGTTSGGMNFMKTIGWFKLLAGMDT
jgi:hypothetical protein